MWSGVHSEKYSVDALYLYHIIISINLDWSYSCASQTQTYSYTYVLVNAHSAGATTSTLTPTTTIATCTCYIGVSKWSCSVHDIPTLCTLLQRRFCYKLFTHVVCMKIGNRNRCDVANSCSVYQLQNGLQLWINKIWYTIIQNETTRWYF